MMLRPAATSSPRLPFMLAFALCLACQFIAARWMPPSSDTVQNYNELLALRTGNLLLHGWVLTPTTYIFSDLPVFALAAIVFGATPRLIYIAPAIVFAAFLAASCRLAAPTSASRRQRYFAGFCTLYLLGLPFTPDLMWLVIAAVHAGALTLSLFTVLLAEPALSGRPLHPVRLAAFGLLTAAAVASDPFCLAYLVGPLMLLVLLRTWLSGRPSAAEWWLAASALLAVGAAFGWLRLVAALGGFTIATSPSFDFVHDLREAATNLYGVLAAIQLLFIARARMLPHVFAMPVIAASRNLAALIVAVLCARIAWRAPRAILADGVPQLLVLAATCVAGLDVVSGQFSAVREFGPGFPYGASRYVLPSYVFGCIAAVIEAGALLNSAWERHGQWAGGILAGMAALFTVAAVQVSLTNVRQAAGIDRSPAAGLADWLVRHGLRHGVGDYWTTNLVTALSRGQVKDSSVFAVGREVRPFAYVTDVTDLPAHRPNFAAFPPVNDYHLTVEALTGAYGPAQAVLHVYGYTVVQFVP